MSGGGTIEAIYIIAQAGGDPGSVEVVEALAGRGLSGDRYAHGGGGEAEDRCQVTFIAAEVLDSIAESGELRVQRGEHRRNIVMRGVSLPDLLGRRFRVGGAVFECVALRPPCKYLEEHSQVGMMRAFKKERGGICTRVLESGQVAVGDGVRVLPA